MKLRPSTLVVRIGMVAGWGGFLLLSGFWIATGMAHGGPRWFQVDWRVYAAGAHDLLDRTLYGEALALDGLWLPVPEFNLPPMSALWALPLAWVPLDLAGLAWQVSMAACLAVGAFLFARAARIPRPSVMAGLIAAVYALHVSYVHGIVGGTNNHLVFVLLGVFVWCHLSGRDRLAGAALSLAVATKLWPAALLVFLVRERRWNTLRWAASGLALQAAVFLAWLGPDVVPDALRALRVTAPIESPVLGIAWLRDNVAWWPAWGAPAVAAALLALPLRGRAAIGTAMLAGLALIPNLWLHYLPSVGVAAALIASDAVAGIRDRRGSAQAEADDAAAALLRPGERRHRRAGLST